MGGTLRGKVDCYINTGSRYTNGQNFFKILYDFCTSHPNMSLIARQGGVSGTSSSVDFHDGTNPFLTNAWFVMRMNDATLESGAANPSGYSGPRTFPYYLYFQWCRFDQQAWNASVSTPGAVDNSTNFGGSFVTLGWQATIASGSIAGTSEVAWNGGGSLGTNTKGTPNWRTTAGTPTGFLGTYTYPRANGPGGTYATNKENSASFFASNNDNPLRVHLIADDDSFLIVYSPNDDGNYAYNYFGLYTPRSGLTINFPMVMIGDSIPHATNTLFGTTAGGSRNGGVAWNSITDNVRGMILSRPDEWHNTFNAPNTFFSTERYDEFNIPIIGNENPSYFGLAGYLDFIREVYDVGTHDGNSTRSRMFFGTTAANSTKLSVPWKPDATAPVGAIIPRTNWTRTGVTF